MNIEEIEELIEIAHKYNILKVSIKDNNNKIIIKNKNGKCDNQKNNGIFPKENLSEDSYTKEGLQEEILAGNVKVVKAPLVGTFYTAPSAGSGNFVEVGDSIVKGQTLGIIEAMKLMNEINAEEDGTVKEILVQRGQLVEFGQPLFIIE